MEEWRATHVEGYEVSNLGRVRSVDRMRRGRYGNPVRVHGRILKPSWHKGYALVSLGFGRRERVHHCVLLAFVGCRPAGAVGRHLDGDPSNNAATNLAWGSHRDNSNDARLHGTISKGESRPLAELTNAAVAAARKRYADGESGASLAREFGVGNQTMMDAITGASWSHLPGAVPSRRFEKEHLRRVYATAKWSLCAAERAEARGEMNNGASCRATAKKWNVSEATMRRIRDEVPV